MDKTQKEFYNQNGYLIIDNFVKPEDCDLLKKYVNRNVAPSALSNDNDLKILNESDPGSRKELKDQFTIASANKIAYFFEPEAINKDGSLKFSLEGSLDKIAYALHDLDPIFNKFCRQPQISQLAKELGLDDPLLMESIYIFKQPDIGCEVTCHQDGTFFYTEPDSTLTFSISLDDCPIDHGCLWGIPGGHREPLKKRMILQDGSIKFVSLEETKTEWDLTKLVPLEQKKGSVIVLHSRFPHMGPKSRATVTDHSIIIRMMDRKSNYPADNWFHRDPKFPPRGFN